VGVPWQGIKGKLNECEYLFTIHFILNPHPIIELIFKEVIRLHDLPKNIARDREKICQLLLVRIILLDSCSTHYY
jgi:hypothetical protein